MKNNEELYGFVDDLAQELKRNGDGQAAEKLITAMISGATGTETFMNLRFELEHPFENTTSTC